MTLERAFPSAPSHMGKYQVKVFRDGDMKALTIFCAKYAARHFIDAVVGGIDYEWIGDNRLEIEVKGGSVVVQSELLREIMDHRMTKEEREWVLPRPYPNYAYQIINGVWQEKSKKVVEERRATAPSKTLVKREKVARPSKEGLVTLTEICAELKIEPRVARAALREAKFEKGESGWAWPSDNAVMIEKIKKIITE